MIDRFKLTPQEDKIFVIRESQNIKLKSHPSIAKVYDVFRTPREYTIVQEFVESIKYEYLLNKPEEVIRDLIK